MLSKTRKYNDYINTTRYLRYHSLQINQVSNNTMAIKVVIFAAFVAVASASYIHAPVAVTKTVVDTEYDHHPEYQYSYGVADALTGDQKSQSESRHGDVVVGQYSLVDSDGTKRTVDYSADAVHGFNAVVSKTPLHAPVAAKVVSAPAVAAYAAPVVAKTVSYAPAISSYTTKTVDYTAPAVATYAHAPVIAKTYAAPAYQTYAAPTVYSAAPVAYNTYAAPASYAHAPVVAKTYGAYAAPVAYNSYAAPAVTKTVISGPSAVSYSAPAVGYASYAAPAYASYAAPAYAKW